MACYELPPFGVTIQSNWFAKAFTFLTNTCTDAIYTDHVFIELQTANKTTFIVELHVANGHVIHP